MSTHSQAFRQYTDLWHSLGEQRKATGLMARINQAGYDSTLAAAEAYRRDPMGVDGVHPDQLAAPDYGVNIFGVTTPVDIAQALKCGVTTINSLPAIVANDTFVPTEPLLHDLPAGVTVCSLNNVPEHLRERVFEALSHTDAASALNAMLLTDGVLIHLAKGVRLERPIQIVNISQCTAPILSARRILVLADEDSYGRLLLCDHSLTDTVEHLNLEIVDVDLARGAEFELYDIEEGSETARRWWRLNARQQSDSRLTANTFFLHGGHTRNEYSIEAAGDHTDTRLGGLAVCAPDRIVDNEVLLRHNGTHGTSRQLFKNALYGNARGGFGGKIIVEEGAVFTDAVQTNRNLLIGDQASMTAAPQLEIYCDEVKCGHGATTGQLDERALFYMQSRGIPADDARNMLTQAFMSDVVDCIGYEVLRQRLHILVEKRLSGAATSCDACTSVCHSPKES